MLEASEVYLDTYSRDIEGLRRALKKRNAKALCELAHRARGGVAVLGAHECAEIACELEQAAERNELERCDLWCESLIASMEAFAREIESYRKA